VFDITLQRGIPSERILEKLTLSIREKSGVILFDRALSLQADGRKMLHNLASP